MGTVPTADVIAVIIGIAVMVMAVSMAPSVAPVIIVVAIVLLVAVSVVLCHSDCRRESQRQNCSRAGLEPSLNGHFTPFISPQDASLVKRPRHRQITVGHGRRHPSEEREPLRASLECGARNESRATSPSAAKAEV